MTFRGLGEVVDLQCKRQGGSPLSRGPAAALKNLGQGSGAEETVSPFNRLSRCSQISSDLDMWQYTPHGTHTHHTHTHRYTQICIYIISFQDKRKGFIHKDEDKTAPRQPDS